MKRPIVLVLQPAKAASMAWYGALRNADGDLDVHHVHYINPRTTERARVSCNVEGERQTFRNRAMFRYGAGWPDASLEQALRERPDDRRPLKIVTTVRDPVERSISLLFFYADFWGHRTLPLSYREGATVDGLLDFFIASWRSAIADAATTGTFEQQFQSELVNYREWFERELNEVLLLDIRPVAFDFERHVLSARNEAVELTVCRYEDLDPTSPALPHILAAVSSMVGAPIRELPQSNATGGRRSRDLYREFRQRVALPSDLIEEIYAAPILRKFYRPEEIDGMKARWAA